MPARTLGLLVGAWLLLGILNYGLIKAGLPLGTPVWFPISIFKGPTVHFDGIPYLLLFLAVIVIACKTAARLNGFHVWLAGLLLIVLGNLGQGDWDTAFYQPFYKGGIQYYHDAIRISSWSGWLELFNSAQLSLLPHTRTHPPFAVLSHHLFLQGSGDNLPLLGMMFLLVSSLSIFLVWHIFRALGVPLERRNLLALMFAVIPAVNIYSAVSLDGVVLAGATLFLFGVVLLLQSGRISRTGLLSMVLGFVITNSLTWAGVFLVAAAGVPAVREYVLSRRINLAASLLVSISAFIAFGALMFAFYGYDHVSAFLTTTALVNPGGFQGSHMPLNYLATRVESVCEVLLFLSFGVLAMLFHPGRSGFSWSGWRNMNAVIMISGIITLLAMFASGAFRTGETARAAMFIYPYIMLAFVNTESRILKDMIILAGLQTFVMQLMGNYFW